MLNVKPVGPGVVSYYLDHGGRPAGRWIGAGCGDLGLHGDVTPVALSALLHGRHPSGGEYLPSYRSVRRRAGWDLIFSAPKSVSLLAAMVPDGADSIAASHGAAVSEALSHLERQLLRLRPSYEQAGRPPISGVVGAAFDHPVNAGAEPHVHTHLILTNLGRTTDGGWSSISNTNWWTARHALSAVYQLGLRHHLAVSGWNLDWRLRPDGLADLAEVPRAAIRATSTQSTSTVAIGPFETRRRATPQPWRERAVAAGMTDGPWFPPGPPPRPPAAPALGAPGGDALHAAVTARLAGRRSDFRQSDVLVALASSHPGGSVAIDAETWAARFCDQAIEVGPSSPTRAPRWTTDLARQADERLTALGYRAASVGDVRQNVTTTALDAVLDLHRYLPSQTASAVREICNGGRTVEILTSPAGETNLLTHAALIDACRTVWQASGLQVAVKARTEEAAVRWEVLTGLMPDRTGGRADVVIVDQVDRRSTPELLAVLSGIEDRGARAILIEGGTLPRLTDRQSTGLTQLGDRLGRVDPGPAVTWTGLAASAAHTTGREAARQVVEAWNQARPGVLMVGLGVDEIRALNSAAREVLSSQAVLHGPPVSVAGRQYQAGDRVIALSRLDTEVARGTRGAVVEVDPGQQRAAVTWDGCATRMVDREDLARMGHGYAVTPALARRTEAPLILLGRPDAVGSLRDRVLSSAAAAASLDLGHDLTRPARRPRLPALDLTV